MTSTESASFESVSIFLPVMDEVESLKQTVETIEADCGSDVKEYLITVCEFTKPEAITACEEIAQRLADRARIVHQTRRFLGGATQDAIDVALGSHFLMMASDLETPPHRVKDFVANAKASPGGVTAGSRWIEGGGFEGYNPLKRWLNLIFQKFFSALYRTSMTDMTYAYRIYPTHVLKSIRWEELRHAFLFESLIKPLKLGLKVTEIPAEWKQRVEGESRNTFMQNFVYFRIGFKTLFYTEEQILK